MKIYIFIFSILMFFVGISLGFWFGVERVYIEQENIPTKTAFDMLSIVASWLGAVGTILALLFAMHVFYKWRKQTLEEHIISNCIEILKLNVSVKTDLSLLVLFDHNENSYGRALSQLKSDLDDLSCKIEIFYALTHGKGDRLNWFIDSFFTVDDFLKDTKIFKEISENFYLLFSAGAIKSNKNEMKFGVTYKAFGRIKNIIDEIKQDEKDLFTIVDKNELNAKLIPYSQGAISSVSKWL